MVNQGKIRVMTRLAILEKQQGKQIRRAENSFRIDLLTNPVWKMGFFASVIFAAAAGILAVLNMNMLLDLFAQDKLKGVIMAVLIAYGSVLLIVVLFAFIRSYRRYKRAIRAQEQYRTLLMSLQSMEEDEAKRNRYSRYAAGRRDAGGDGDDWEDPDDGRGRRNGRSSERKDLDWRHTQTLEFEDDEYRYYVEATPKRGGSREWSE